MKNLQTGLRALRQADRYRHRLVHDGPQGINLSIDGETLVSFCSNDYLGLANHPKLAKAAYSAIQRYGVGSGAAHLVTGHTHEHHALEKELAAFTGRERALLFSTGYMANLGVISSLAGRGDQVFEDRINHASLIDGARLSDARLTRFRHRDYAGLETRLASTKGGKLVASDGLFSMEGDEADLNKLASLCRKHKAWLLIDDAHGIGVSGDHGRGTLEAQGCSPGDAPILVGTLGKALGTFGAFVAGDEVLIETLIQKARTYIFTTAPPPAIAAATRAALKLIDEENWRRKKLRGNITYFRKHAIDQGIPLADSDSPIQPVILGSDRDAIQASEQLRSRGILVTAIRPPTVPEGTSRLRITLSAEHDDSHIDRLIESLATLKPIRRLRHES